MKNLCWIGDLPARAAAAWGSRVALIFDNRRYSYEDLQRSVSTLAATLRDFGLERGGRVAVHLENRPEYLHAYYAVPLAGGVVVPLNTFLAPAELHEMLIDCGAGILITSSESLKKIAPALKELPDLREVLIFGDRGADQQPASPRPNRRYLPAELAKETPAVAPVGPPPSQDDTAVMIFTSGTTGTPKGVMLTHRNLLSNAEASIVAVGVTEADRILVFLPLFHSFTEMVGLLAPLMAGMSIVLCEKLDRAEIRRAIVRHKPTIFPGVPAVFSAMSQAKIGLVARWLNPVRLYISGGAPLSTDTLKRFEALYRRPLCEGYGLSEASPVVALNPPAGPRKSGSIGLPVPGVEVMVADGAGRPVPAGETGELLVKGANVMKGYYGLPEETERALKGGWLHTGDLAQRDAEGYLFIMGRSKEMLISRGMNIYPREIEDVLEADPRVREAAVIGVPDVSRGEVPLAFVVAEPGHEPTEAELRRACLEKLARYKVPREIRFLTELPRNPAGKVLKETLKSQADLSPAAEATPGARVDRARQAGT